MAVPYYPVLLLSSYSTVIKIGLKGFGFNQLRNSLAIVRATTAGITENARTLGSYLARQWSSEQIIQSDEGTLSS